MTKDYLIEYYNLYFYFFKLISIFKPLKEDEKMYEKGRMAATLLGLQYYLRIFSIKVHG